MLVLEIALGIVLGVVLLYLITCKAFWQFLGGCIGLIVLLLLYANKNTEFMKNAIHVSVVIFYGLLGIVIVFLLWYNRKKIPGYIKNTPTRIKKWLTSEQEEWRDLNIVRKTISIIGLILLVGLLLGGIIFALIGSQL